MPLALKYCFKTTPFFIPLSVRPTVNYGLAFVLIVFSLTAWDSEYDIAFGF